MLHLIINRREGYKIEEYRTIILKTKTIILSAKLLTERESGSAALVPPTKGSMR